MKYAKPEVVAAGPAIEAIATSALNKHIQLVQDRFYPQQTTPSAGAYESDE
jgi:hypothetical protein